MKKAKPLAQDSPAFMGTSQAQPLAFVGPPVTHKILPLPKADVADRATVDLLLPVSLLVRDQPGQGAEALAAAEAAVRLLCEVGLLVPGEMGLLTKSQRTVQAREDLES